MWRPVNIVQTDVSEERIASIFILSLQPPAHAGTSLADFSTLKMEAIRSSETSVYTISTRCHIPEGGILHSHGHENLKSSYKPNSVCRLLLLVSCLAYSSTLKIEAICSSETLACLRTTRHYNPEDRTFQDIIYLHLLWV
jgi:hypothetical protein